VFTTIAVAAYYPEAMPFTRVVSLFPFVGEHRTVASLYDQIAHDEASFFGHSDEVAMSPLRAVIVHHVGDFGQQ